MKKTKTLSPKMTDDGDGAIPDHLRCNRTDGRQWRCKRRVKTNLKLCEIHYLQGRHRQFKQKVPDSLKLQRNSTSLNGTPPTKTKTVERSRRSVQIRAKKVEIKAKLMKRKRSSSEGLRKRLKRGAEDLDLIRMVLKREVEKSNERSLRERDFVGDHPSEEDEDEEDDDDDGDDDDGEEELTRDLPNGLMAISSTSSSPSPSNAGSDSPCRVKLGDAMMRRIRSKNVQASPSGNCQLLPCLGKEKRKRCHWCRRSGSQILTKCSSCQRQFFCLECIKERYFDTQEEVKEACPVCRRTCTCKECFKNSSTDTESKEFLGEKHKVEVILCIHYLICMLLPVLKQINEDQNDELEIESRIKGNDTNSLNIKQAVIGSNEQHCCNKCKDSILDLHRSCPNCSYNLCLSCCRDLHQGGCHESTNNSIPICSNQKISRVLRSTQRIEKKPIRTKNSSRKYVDSSVSLQHWKAHDGNVEAFCPPIKFGGCGASTLELRCLFPSTWTRELEARAEEMVCSYEFPDTSDINSSCSLCHCTNQRAEGINQLQEAAVRKGSSDNFLYYPALSEISGDNVEHFQKHWLKGHPVIVRNVLKATSHLSWDPVLMFCTYLERSISSCENNGDLCEATSCLDWCEVEIGISQCFMGSFKGETHKNSWNETLKLKGWLSSHLFKRQFPAHFAEIIHTLPLQEYMNPVSGLLNLAARLPQEIQNPDLGPCLYISCGYAEQLVQADSVIKLHYASYDMVNVLAHTSDVPISSEHVSKVRKLLKKHKAQKQSLSAKVTSGQNLVNECERKASLPDNKNKGTRSLDMVGEEMHLRKKVARVSCSSAAAQGSCDRKFIQSNMSGVESDSQELLDSDRTIEGTETSEDGKSSRAINKNSRCNGKNSLASSSCVAHWDIFRRQDVSKLIEYLRKHSNEFACKPGSQVVNPILEQCFFLDAYHKLKLKQEYMIEPWTFQQHAGEAVIIPAGCPYQIRSPKSCVHVVLDFISPEHVTECVQLTDEIRQLPESHKAKVDKLEVKKMALHSLSKAVKDIRELTCAT